MNDVLDFSGASGYRDISFIDFYRDGQGYIDNSNNNSLTIDDFTFNYFKYNYYAILKNDDGNNKTSFFERYEDDYSGNIFLLGSVINNVLNFCQVKLKNQHNYVPIYYKKRSSLSK